MNPSIELPQANPITNVALGVLLIFFSGCTAMRAQQEIDTVKDQFATLSQAGNLALLDQIERNSKCRGAQDTYIKLLAQPSNPQFQPVLDYISYAYEVQKYMDEKVVTAETALTVMGDLILPPQLPKGIDPFPGCILLLGDPPERTATYQPGQKFADVLVFFWQSIDWREAEQARFKIFNKYLPPEKRATFVRFLTEYVWTLRHALNERREKGELTVLQEITAVNAAADYLVQQMNLHDAQLNENLVRAKAEDAALMTTVAVGLGAVATAALAVVNTYENYRIANAQTSMARTMQLQALQAQAPIVCNYTLPVRYGTQGYVYCR